jgi:hypothetical protein
VETDLEVRVLLGGGIIPVILQETLKGVQSRETGANDSSTAIADVSKYG